ncbi:FAD/NAD(P)-binding protein [Mucilaginibacter terrenus]|uniref:FAD/NAD(P)-binding protein n=1 Tax=Mucilaginibacter terrenus TaxID=2482727 RepID=UPI00197C3AD1|nr:FAD/NAD(P)-binding protein [Mucilaginibacter terrenus]
MNSTKHIGIIGGGPSALFMVKRLVDAGNTDLQITIFEKKNQLGAGMPYSHLGANDEHVTNVSDNEIPELVTTISEWIKTVPEDTLNKFNIRRDHFNEYKVLPRLLFGQYLAAQFKLVLAAAKEKGIAVQVNYNTTVVDIIDQPKQETTLVITEAGDNYEFDHIVLCTGHRWPKVHEGKIPGYFDSPYPPSKLGFKVNTPVAVRGASLTAIDAIRTLSRHNGSYQKDTEGVLTYKVDEASKGFRLVLHSRNGMLPAVRFHLEDSHLGKDTVLSNEEIAEAREKNEGFLPLDLVFDRNFKESFKAKRPAFYKRIKDVQMEEFVNFMMAMREQADPFELLQAEYKEAEKSIEAEESVYWKEMLAVLSFAMNYPAKYFSAEDMLRVQKTLMPLISIVIAFVPQSSVEELLALWKAGVLTLVSVGDDSEVEPVDTGGIVYHYTDEDGKKVAESYPLFVDSIGQPHLSYNDLPYPGLRENLTVTPAKLLFRDAQLGAAEMEHNKKVEKDRNGDYVLTVPGVAINDAFQAVDAYGALNDRIYIMAVPYIGGFNPDYSGLDFSEAASERIAKAILHA